MKQKRNSIMRGSSGALGNELVFRQRAGQTIMSLPAVPGPDNPTDEQLGVRSRFKEAIAYARTAIANPALKAAYRAKTSKIASPFNTAMADFCKAPVITKVDVSNYNGSAGSTILINATDDFKVQAVHVSIFNGAGDVIEEGAAIVNPESGDYWTFTLPNAIPDGALIKVQASDLPGNVTMQELSL